jgi:uncharacterized membrane protein (UPF0127 family)
MSRRVALVALVTVAVGGCERPEPDFVSPVTFDTATAWIHTGGDSISLLVEVARTAAQKSYGLMGRPSLDSTSGMIFVYDTLQPPTAGFWMFRTKVPLDIAFIDSAGVIVKLLAMDPCESEMYASACETYVPNEPYRAALEVNAAWFVEHGVGEGSVVRLEGEAPAQPAPSADSVPADSVPPDNGSGA